MENIEWKEFAKVQPKMDEMVLMSNSRGAQTFRYNYMFAQSFEMQKINWLPITHWARIKLPQRTYEAQNTH